MGMSEFYGPTDEQESIATIHRALELGVTFLDTADMYGPFTNERAGGPGDRRPPRPGGARHQVRQRARARTARGVGVNGRPEYVRSACEASLQRLGHRPHRPLLPAPRRPNGADRGDRRRDGRAGRARARSATSGSRRPSPADDPPRPRRPPDHRAADRVLAVVAATPRTSVLPTVRELGIGFVAYSPLGRGFLTGRYQHHRTTCPRTTSAATIPAFQGENCQHNLEAGGAGRGDRRERRGARRRSWRWPGCSARARTSCRSPGPSAPVIPGGERRRRRAGAGSGDSAGARRGLAGGSPKGGSIPRHDSGQRLNQPGQRRPYLP